MWHLPCPRPSISVQNRPRCKREQSRVRKFFSGNPYSRISNAAEELGISFDMVWTILRNNWTRNRTVIYPQYTHAVKTGACTIRLKGEYWFEEVIWADESGSFSLCKHYRNNTVHWLMGSKRNKVHLRRMAGRARRRAELCWTKLADFLARALSTRWTEYKCFWFQIKCPTVVILMVYRFTVFPVDICMPVTVPLFYSFINDHPVFWFSGHHLNVH